MKVKEYLVNRILDLEKDLKQVRNEYAGVSHCLELQKNKIDALDEKLEQYQIEREHIREIITCNINSSGDLVILNHENDLKTLMPILDIKPEDYTKNVVKEEKHDQPPTCWGCKYEAVDGDNDPCAHCFSGDKREPKEVTTDAETTD